MTACLATFEEREWEFGGGVSWRIRLEMSIINPNPMFGMMWELLGELKGCFFSVREVRHHGLVPGPSSRVCKLAQGPQILLISNW
jgi:hypothetical protein